MGAGKSTVGRILARRLKWKFYDLDDAIEQRERRTIARIFAESGEDGFRDIENAALMELLRRSENGCVIALGGGAFTQQRNRAALEEAGAVTVLLSAPVEELQRRCQSAENTRPLAKNEARFKQLYSDRQQAYALAHFRVETAGKAISRVAEEIESLVFST